MNNKTHLKERLVALSLSSQWQPEAKAVLDECIADLTPLGILKLGTKMLKCPASDGKYREGDFKKNF